MSKKIPVDKSRFRDGLNTGASVVGAITEASSTTISVPTGQGVIMDTTTNPNNISTQSISWGADAAFVITMADDFGVQFIFINSSGTIQQQDTQLTSQQKTENIYLAAVSHQAGAIDDIVNEPQMIQSTARILADFLDFLPDSSKLSGAIIGPVTAQLQVFREAGSFFTPGINHFTNPKDANKTAVAADGNDTTPLDFDVILSNETIDSVGTETMPKERDVAGVPTALTGIKATIHYLFSFAGNNLLQMGQVEYSDAATAITAADSDLNNFDFAEGIRDGILLAQIVVGNNASDFSDATKAQIINRRGGGGGSGAGGAMDTVFPQYFIKAQDFTAPNNADYAVNGNAANFQDDVNNGFTVALHDDSTEQGKAFQFIIPTGATSMKITTKYKAMVAPPAARTAGQNFYERASESTVDAWSSAIPLDDMDFEADLEYNIITQTITLATLNLTAGQEHQMMITREPTPLAGTNLVDDMGLRWRLFEFI